ncbi:FHA domain-containing protein [Colwellia sp. 6_MG-2023]|uniref:FHA domain-containing protein n=1 Tax=Colwellia sp. 6_MG-2023 TaxID=3062676 RepID=UPI0026E24733|nr:FHA domain-containing protein [Colwellia sp. 6_MG-2023]MDO6488141.1 FHA domain-containing protein [Colwellia sp. 6_MG-2023]
MEVTTTDMPESLIDNDEIAENQSLIEKIAASEIIIEEISRNHKLLHRHRLSKPQIHIGRDYHNDIILDDPHICPSHISIDEIDGQWKITDNQTLNGSYIENKAQKKRPANEHIINDGDIITLGKSQLRILFNHHPVEPTLPFSPFESFINLMRHPVVLLSSLILFTLIAGNVFYLNTSKEVNFSQLLVPTIGMTLGFALWPAGVALVSYLSKNETRIMAQIGISFAFFNLMWFSDFLEGVVKFNSTSDSLAALLIVLISIALAFSLFWLNSYIGFHMSARRRLVVAASMTLLLFGGSYLVQYSNKPDFDPRPQYNATIMMPSFLISSSASVDDFIGDSSKLFDKTKQEAVKE